MMWRICGTGELSLEWKREEVMDGVMVVTDDERERGWRNEAGKLFQRLQLGDAYRKERSVISRDEDEGGREMVMSGGDCNILTF